MSIRFFFFLFLAIPNAGAEWDPSEKALYEKWEALENALNELKNNLGSFLQKQDRKKTEEALKEKFKETLNDFFQELRKATLQEGNFDPVKWEKKLEMLMQQAERYQKTN
jgi:predicted DNA-binding protein YlxM (UPF0122 family)